MRFVKRDLASKLNDVIHEEQLELAGKQKRFDAIRPKWFEADRECAESGALLNAQAATYTRASEPLFREHTEMLTREKEARIAKRDSLLGTLPGDITELTDRIARRLSCLSGAFGGFISGVTDHNLSGGSRPQCSPELQAELRAARKHAETLTDPAELLGLIEKTVSRIEDEDLQFIPLFRMDQVIERALAVEGVRHES
jgi:hypothetical protein